MDRVYTIGKIAALPAETVSQLLHDLNLQATEACESYGENVSLLWMQKQTATARKLALVNANTAGFLLIHQKQLTTVTYLTNLLSDKSKHWTGAQLSNNITAPYVARIPKETTGGVIAVPMYLDEAAALGLRHHTHNISQQFDSGQDFIWLAGKTIANYFGDHKQQDLVAAFTPCVLSIPYQCQKSSGTLAEAEAFFASLSQDKSLSPFHQAFTMLVENRGQAFICPLNTVEGEIKAGIDFGFSHPHHARATWGSRRPLPNNRSRFRNGTAIFQRWENHHQNGRGNTTPNYCVPLHSGYGTSKGPHEEAKSELWYPRIGYLTKQAKQSRQ